MMDNIEEYAAEYKRKYESQYRKKYRQTPNGRAYNMLKNYNRLDEKYGRGKGNLTTKWLLNNILFKACVYCGLQDWRLIGCNRLDNSLPHTTDNVEPCCRKCNIEQQMKELRKKVYQYTLEGELVGVYESTKDAAIQTGFDTGHISECCNGKRKTYKGYIWSYVPL